MIELVLSDFGEWMIVIIGSISAVLSFIAFGKLRGSLVPIKRIYLLSFGLICVSIATLFLSVYLLEPSLGLIALNRVIWLFTILLIGAVSVDILRIKQKYEDYDKKQH